MSVQWEEGDSAGAAAQLIDDLDGGYEELEAAGWAIPVSSDRYYLPVVLDPHLSGTGLTLEYYDDRDYPEGYPVLYVHPEWWTSYPAFFRHVAMHELAHAFQFAVRDYAGGTSESWYWEASAEWSVEEVRPRWDQYVSQVPYYTEQPELRLDSGSRYHPYGMLVLNAYLEVSRGPEAMRDTWQANGGLAWPDALEAATDTPVEELVWAASGTLASGGYPDSPLWPSPEVERVVVDLADGETWAGAEWLGTHYVEVADAPGPVEVLGNVRAAFVTEGGWTGETPAAGSYTIAITALEDGPEVTVRLRSADDTGAGADSGDAEDGATVDLSSALVGCGCGHERRERAGLGSLGAAAVSGLGLAALRRRLRAPLPGRAGAAGRSPARG